MADKSKFRHFMLLLYPDDTSENHKEVIDTLPLYDSVWILHDKDTDDNGHLIKPHIHAILSFLNPRYESAVAKELNIDERWLEPIRDLKQSLGYLIHNNDSSKYQYSIDEVKGNVQKLREIRILRRDTIEAITSIFDYIDSNNNATMRNVFRFCLDNDIADIYISKNLIIKNYLKG